MLVRMNPYLLLLAAAVATLFSGAMWYAYVRPAFQLSAWGVILGTISRDARTIQRYQGGPRAEVWSQDSIRIPAESVLRIRIDGLPAEAFFPVATAESERYKVGEKVLVRYEKRGFPWMTPRIRIVEITREDTP